MDLPPAPSHLSRNYPLILAGGRGLGVSHGQYLNHAGAKAYRGGWKPGDKEPWTQKAQQEDVPLSNLFVSMLHRLGVETDAFADSARPLEGCSFPQKEQDVHGLLGKPSVYLLLQ